jgi:hypothetical protein
MKKPATDEQIAFLKESEKGYKSIKVHRTSK